MTKPQLKNMLKESLTVQTSVRREWFAGRDGCMGYHAIVTQTEVLFDGEVISTTRSKAVLG